MDVYNKFNSDTQDRFKSLDNSNLSEIHKEFNDSYYMLNKEIEKKENNIIELEKKIDENLDVLNELYSDYKKENLDNETETEDDISQFELEQRINYKDTFIKNMKVLINDNQEYKNNQINLDMKINEDKDKLYNLFVEKINMLVAITYFIMFSKLEEEPEVKSEKVNMLTSLVYNLNNFIELNLNLKNNDKEKKKKENILEELELITKNLSDEQSIIVIDSIKNVLSYKSFEMNLFHISKNIKWYNILYCFPIYIIFTKYINIILLISFIILNYKIINNREIIKPYTLCNNYDLININKYINIKIRQLQIILQSPYSLLGSVLITALYIWLIII